MCSLVKGVPFYLVCSTQQQQREQRLNSKARRWKSFSFFIRFLIKIMLHFSVQVVIGDAHLTFALLLNSTNYKLLPVVTTG